MAAVITSASPPLTIWDRAPHPLDRPDLEPLQPPTAPDHLKDEDANRQWREGDRAHALKKGTSSTPDHHTRCFRGLSFCAKDQQISTGHQLAREWHGEHCGQGSCSELVHLLSGSIEEVQGGG